LSENNFLGKNQVQIFLEKGIKEFRLFLANTILISKKKAIFRNLHSMTTALVITEIFPHRKFQILL
jgi:hypothetical protein